MWPKFGNSSLSMKEVIMTSIFKGFDQRERCFEGVFLVPFQEFGTNTKYGLKMLHECGKRIQLQVTKL